MRVDARSLEMLEWPQLVERLQALARTPGGRRRCGPDRTDSLFAGDDEEMRENLARTSEARALRGAGANPADEIPDVAALLHRAEVGGALGARELQDVAAAIEGIAHAQRVLATQAAMAPRLGALGASLGDHRDVAEAVRFSIDAEGEVRNAASSILAEARAETRRLAGELQRRLDASLRDPAIAPYLSDHYVTVRNDRYVLPVRADARSHVRGIVHDASASGTTLFVEPQPVVDLNNRLKEAELRIERETIRILRDLSERTGREAPGLRVSLEVFEEIDLACARGALSEQQGGVEPEVRDEGVIRLPQLRHPLLSPASAVPNDLLLGEGFRVLVLSGPNAGGKTVAMKSLALAVLAARAGLHVAADAGARIDGFDALLADVGDAQSLRDNLSTFSAHLANLASIVETASRRTLVVLDEIGDGTDPGEGAALAQAVLETLAGAGARVVATTHYNLLKEMAAVDSRFENGSFEFDPVTLAPTYRLRLGTPGVSSATAVAARMGLRRDVLERAQALLERDDRRLERMLSELAESRLALEHERQQARQLRAETESERDEMRRKLLKLQERRDRIYGEMRRDLEVSFRSAHEEVARVIRELQRGGGARAAARAREELLAIEVQTRETEQRTDALEPRLEPVDWTRAVPGEVVALLRGGTAELLALPDRKGLVAVRAGSARLLVPADQVGRAAPAAPPAKSASRREPERVHIDVSAPEGAPTARCDLRGQRVDEALDGLATALDRAALSGAHRLLVIHGLGTGALRKAVREHLARSPYTLRFSPARAEDGGDGVTEVVLSD